ncbi:MAG: ATP-binding protein [Methylococcaceae bacterium]|nr:ATP-binding protein [Methylococcaceae bacterium]MDP3905463.1 ATP-binding protein [Methylococcaceae bacterium]
MGRLFWKFFLTFWLALLVAGIGVGTAVWLRHNTWQNSGDELPRAAIDVRHASSLLEVAVSAYRYGGDAELRQFLGKLHAAHLPPVYAVDDQDRDILQRNLAPEILQQARALFLQAAYPEAIRLVSSGKGQNYLLFVPLPEHGFSGHPPLMPPNANTGADFAGHPPAPLDDHSSRPPRPPSPLLPILAGTFASLLFSAALAWYFAKPIRSLRNAFAAVAKGNLDTRVGALMSNRRDELSDLGQDFDHMAGQIYSLVHAQQRLLHDVSHELRSPLARIQAAIGLAQQQPNKHPAMLERIEHESQRMSDLVGELLVLARLEAGVSDSASHEFDIGDLLDGIVEDARFEAAQHEVVIRYEGIEETLVKGRGELLHRAFENVLRNALQHCQKYGEVTVIVSFDIFKRRLKVTIDDQGPGVAESDLSAIFEPFFRSGDRSKADSIGLGLAIAYRSITAHGGLIQAENRPQGGLRMEIEIPFVE